MVPWTITVDPHCHIFTFSYAYSLTLFLLPWLHTPDSKLANTFLCAVCWNRIGCERKIGQCVYEHVLLNMDISLSKYGNTGCVFAKCLSVQPIIQITSFFVLSLVCISDDGWGKRMGGITFIGEVS